MSSYDLYINPIIKWSGNEIHGRKNLKLFVGPNMATYIFQSDSFLVL